MLLNVLETLLNQFILFNKQFELELEFCWVGTHFSEFYIVAGEIATALFKLDEGTMTWQMTISLPSSAIMYSANEWPRQGRWYK